MSRFFVGLITHIERSVYTKGVLVCRGPGQSDQRRGKKTNSELNG